MRFEEIDRPAVSDAPVKYEPKPALAAGNDPMPYREPRPDGMNLDILQDNLGHCLDIIDDEVMKGYVTRLDRLAAIRPEEGFEKNLNDIHFFKISELVYQEDEFSVDKLAMVFHALSNKPCTLVLMLRSNGEQTDFYLGARPWGSNSAGTLFQMLKQSLMGVFPGSRISNYFDEDMRRDMQSVNVGCISSVTCVADYKRDSDNITNKEFIQGLEKFVYAMQGKGYTAVLIADNVSRDELMGRKREYEQIYTQISPFANMQMSFTASDTSSASAGGSEGRTVSVSKGSSVTRTHTDTHTEGTSETVGQGDTVTYTDTHTVTESEAEGKTHTTGSTDGVSRTVSNSISVGISRGSTKDGKTKGFNAGYSRTVSNGTSHTDSVSDSISRTLTHGFSDSRGSSHGHSDTKSFGSSHSDGVSESMGTGITETAGEAFNLVNTRTLTDSFGSSRGVTLNVKNMTLNLMLGRIEKHLERIEECESFGMWNFAAYFLGETAAETETAANTYKSVIAGNDSGIERSAVNSWSDEDSISCISPYIRNFLHPMFVYEGFSYEGIRRIAVDPSALVSTNELAIHMGLPKRSVRGLPVVGHAPFAQEVITWNPGDGEKIDAGVIFHMGQKTGTEVELDVNSLAMHTFITGSTGSGKSNAVYYLVSEARRKGIHFLVVEPAKGEYKDVFADVKCYGTNPLRGEILKINPFSFPEEVHVLEHIDRIIEIFNVCWPMYAAMPAVLKESVEQAYISAGWDMDLSVNTKVPGLFPTFDDVLRELDAGIRASAYSADTKGDYIGSLSTRLKSLTNGINGRIFVSDEMCLEDLFDKDAIIDISRVGSLETKSLIMGLVVLKLQEYRMSGAGRMNVPLKHLTVLEEAHNLLKKTSTEQSAESSNLIGKSVEMLTNAIAEIRTYGEGFVIVDQAPNLLDTAAIRNTNTKLVLRLPENMDREVTGGAMALNEQQCDELSKLPTGVAAVYQNDWQEAVLCALPKYMANDGDFPHRNAAACGMVTRKEKSLELLRLLLKRQLTGEELELAERLIKSANASAKIRRDLILNLDKKGQTFEWAVADFIQKNFNVSDVFRGTSNCSRLEEMDRIMRRNIEGEFKGFSVGELRAVMYFICRTEHERNPENRAIELFRLKYLKEKVV